MRSNEAYCLTSAIGSLPHHNVDAALSHALQYDVPALPQIPIRHYQEYMIPQALAGLPGLLIDPDGSVMLDVNAWKKGASSLEAQIKNALATQNFSAFLPSADSTSCWAPFLWEIQERQLPFAKVQTAGPMTCQWVITLSNGSHVENNAELGAQIMSLITVKTMAMVQKIKALGAVPVVFLDEPGLYAFNKENPKHLVAMQEVRFLISALRKQGAIVGLHCCSNTDWKTVLELNLNIVSFDVALSLDKVLENRAEVISFVESGGRFSLGVIPTNVSELRKKPAEIFTKMQEKISHVLAGNPRVHKQILQHSFLTPACGLALKSTGEAEAILSELKEFQRLCRSVL